MYGLSDQRNGIPRTALSAVLHGPRCSAREAYSVQGMDELPGGIRRVTLPLPPRPGPVHAYLLPGEDGWTLVDTGVDLPDAKETWAARPEQAAVGGARGVVPPPRGP